MKENNYKHNLDQSQRNVFHFMQLSGHFLHRQPLLLLTQFKALQVQAKLQEEV